MKIAGALGVELMELFRFEPEISDRKEIEKRGSVLTSAIKSLTKFTEFAEKIKKPSDLCERIRVSANGKDFHVADDRINPQFCVWAGLPALP